MSRIHRLPLPGIVSALLAAFLFPHPAPAQEKQTVQDVYAQAIKQYEAGQYQEALKGFQTVLKYQPNFVYARSYAAKCVEALKKGDSARPTLEAGLTNLVVPSVNFEGTSLGLVFQYLTQKSEELSQGKVVANFIYRGTDQQKENTKVTLSLRNTPFRDVIRYVGQLTNTEFKYEEFAIVATPAGQAPTPTSAPAPTLESKFDAPPATPAAPVPPADPFPKKP